MAQAKESVTMLLHEWQNGDVGAAERLVPLLYDELRRLAMAYMRSERQGHTLQPTALVHEAFFRLVDQRSVRWQSRSHFMSIAARLMRRILVDYARNHTAAKRGSGNRVTLHDELAVTDAGTSALDLLLVEDALERLGEMDARQASIVELRFFGGLGVAETAAALDISSATVKREWTLAKAWLQRELAEQGAGRDGP